MESVFGLAYMSDGISVWFSLFCDGISGLFLKCLVD
jgi:hypothetical protein